MWGVNYWVLGTGKVQIPDQLGSDGEHKPKQHTDIDNSLNALGQFPGDPLHQRDHALVLVIVAGDDPHQPKAVHHLRGGGQDHTEVCSCGQVLPQSRKQNHK